MARCVRWTWGLAVIGLCGFGIWTISYRQVEAETKVDDAALERTRKQVRMLDDIYKNAVVLITDKYVHKEGDFSAGSAAVALFAVMKEKGYHEARLLDATGEPYNDKNAPTGEFEKAAVNALKSGKAYYEEIVTVDGKPYLKAATPIPVVSKKCTMCHPHYAQAKDGQAIGALGYTIRIE